MNTAVHARILRRMKPELICIEKECEFCGSRLEVTAVEVAGEPRVHHYACPQCGKPDELLTTGFPHVRVLAPRTDGKTGSYQQTMF